MFDPPTSPDHPYVLRLYVAGSAPKSSRSITNLKAVRETHLKGRDELTVVDLYEKPGGRTEDHEIVVAPMLIPTFRSYSARRRSDIRRSSLSAHSDGVGTGASFTRAQPLQLPLAS